MQGHEQPLLEVLSFGETIIDFLPSARARLRDVESFHKVVGGAPGNVAIGLARLGRRVGMMGRVGADEFGYFLRDEMIREGVDVSQLLPTRDAHTGCTFVSLDERGERSFLTHPYPAAHTKIRPDEIDTRAFASSDIALFGTNLLVEEPSRAASFEALEAAKRAGCFIIIDPNIRTHIWPQRASIAPVVWSALAYADMVKLNDEEIQFLGRGRGARGLYKDELAPRGIHTLLATRGGGGAEIFTPTQHVAVDAPTVDVVDTTGAGDGFVAGVLAAICEQTEDLPSRREGVLRGVLSEWDARVWQRVLNIGCHVGSHVCKTLGATPGLPTREQIPWRAIMESTT